jgi:hypothetical protein
VSTEPSPAARFAALCRERRLGYQVGPDGPRFPPVPGGGDWAVSAGLGVVHATTVMRPRDGAPADLSLVELDEGFRMLSRVVEISPEAVEIGMRVQLEWTEEDPPVPVFRPVP